MREIKTIETHSSCEALAGEWRRLEEECPSSGYQTSRWVIPWLRTVGASQALEPLLILARDESGAPASLFALTLDKKAAVRVAAYAGGRDSNINLPLVRPDVRFDTPTIQRILTEAARQAVVDAFVLHNQPNEWRGRPHPMSALPGQPSPSLLHVATLPASGEDIIAQMNADSRKRTRWRLRKLEEVGPISFIHARTRGEVEEIVGAFRQQKKIRIQDMGAGAGFDIDMAATFLEEAALAEPPGVELQALRVGDRIAAMYAGVVHAGCYHAMVNSYDASPDIARTSPGELMTIRLLQSLADRGLESFDLGVGEAAYKDKWCDRHEPLFDTLMGVTAKGKAYAAARGAGQRIKRGIKQSEWLWPLAKKLRARLGRGA